jgi:hypothetical protein
MVGVRSALNEKPDGTGKAYHTRELSLTPAQTDEIGVQSDTGTTAFFAGK